MREKYPGRRVLLDCDGILAVFDKAAFMACAARYETGYRSYGEYVKKYPNGEWNMPKVMGLTEEQFWAAIDGATSLDSWIFWRDMPAYPCAKWFYRQLCKLAPVTICTCASYGHGFWSGRSEWLSETLGVRPKDLNLIILRGVSKGEVASPAMVLVDDADHNIAAYRAAGGRAVLFPRRWNTRHLAARKTPSRLYGSVLDEVTKELSV